MGLPSVCAVRDNQHLADMFDDVVSAADGQTRSKVAPSFGVSTQSPHCGWKTDHCSSEQRLNVDMRTATQTMVRG